MSARPIPAPDNVSEVFDALTSGEYSNFALVSTALDGEPTWAIAVVQEHEDGSHVIVPLFVWVTPGVGARLVDPATGLE